MEYCYTFITALVWFTPGVMALLTFKPEASISNFHTAVGKIDTTTVSGDINCMVECFMDTTCVTVGYISASNACQKYSVDLTDFSNGIISQPGTSFYKASCSLPGYTYVRWLSACIKLNNTAGVPMATAKLSCESEGASLLEVNSSDIKDYLRDILFRIHNTDFQYLLGGNLVGSNWTWVQAGAITENNGGMFWGFNEPNNASGDCMVLKSEYSNLVIAAVNCSSNSLFICAKQM